jgi:hypothetical protein
MAFRDAGRSKSSGSKLPIPDTKTWLTATSQVTGGPMKSMIRKAAEAVTAAAELYREMTLNALRLMPRRS